MGRSDTRAVQQYSSGPTDRRPGFNKHESTANNQYQAGAGNSARRRTDGNDGDHGRHATGPNNVDLHDDRNTHPVQPAEAIGGRCKLIRGQRTIVAR